MAVLCLQSRSRLKVKLKRLCALRGKDTASHIGSKRKCSSPRGASELCIHGHVLRDCYLKDAPGLSQERLNHFREKSESEEGRSCDGGIKV